MKSFEYTGYWWLASNPEKQLTGSLKFDPINGATLDLIGSFKDIPNFQDSTETTLILGFANGKKVTLFQCYDRGSQMNMTSGMPVFQTSSFIANYVFIGHYFEKPEDILFTSLSINYSHIEEWTRITGFSFTLRHDAEHHMSGYDVSYEFPKDIFQVQTQDFLISFDYYFHDGGDRIKEFKLEQTTFIKITPVGALHLNDYLTKICYHLQNFISLGIGMPVYPIVIKGRNENCKTERDKGKFFYDDIEIFYQARSGQDTSKQLHPLEMFFFLGDIRDNYELYLKNWFNKAEALQPVYDLYFAILYSSKMYLQHRFITLTQALEAYHRRILGGKYAEDAEYVSTYKALVSAIPGSLEEGFKTSLKTKMKYGNEFSLRKRLNEIIEKLGDVVDYLIINRPLFIEDVVNTRNFLTHYDKSLEGKEKNGHELYLICEQLEFLVEVCFLSEIGMPVDKIKALVKRNKKYKYLAENVRKA